MANIDLNRIAKRWSTGNQKAIRTHVEALFDAIRSGDEEGVQKNLAHLEEGQTILDMRMGVENLSALTYAIEREGEGAQFKKYTQEQQYNAKPARIARLLLKHYQNEDRDIGTGWATEPLEKALSLGMDHWTGPLWSAGQLDLETKSVHRSLMLNALRGPVCSLTSLLAFKVMEERLLEVDGYSHRSLGDLLIEKIMDRVVDYSQESFKQVKLLQEKGVDIKKHLPHAVDGILFTVVRRCLAERAKVKAEKWCEGLIELGFDPLVKNQRGFDLLAALSNACLPLDLTYFEGVKARAEQKLLFEQTHQARSDQKAQGVSQPSSLPSNRLRV